MLQGVAPFVGVWIEMVKTVPLTTKRNVAPFVGVWIEICVGVHIKITALGSLPLWECGLKYDVHF